MNWSALYPFYAENTPGSNYSNAGARVRDNTEHKPARTMQKVEIVDIGCGFGGLLFALAPVLLDTLIIGTSSVLLDFAFVSQTKVDSGQEWRSVLQSPSLSRRKSKLCDRNRAKVYSSILRRSLV